MTTFTLIIECDNAAFDDDNLAYEVARILQDTAERIESAGLSNGGSNILKDVNGNTVGSFKLT